MHNHQKEEGIEKNFLEWGVFGCSILLILAVLGYLTYQAITFAPSPPSLYVTYRHDPSQEAPFRFHVTIINRGGETAEEVKVEASLEKDGHSVEKAELTVPFSPKGSRREGWVVFKTDPNQSDSLLVRVVSFRRP